MHRENASTILSVADGAPGHHPVDCLHIDSFRIVADEVAK